MTDLTNVDPAYLTHQKFLAHYIQKTKGAVLELGTGFGSTPLLRELLNNSGRKLISVDHNQEWINKMKEICPPNEFHEYIYTDNWCGTIMELTKYKFDVVFIDQNPWEARAIALYAFKDLVDYTIVHDVDYFPRHKIFGNYISDFEFDFGKEFQKWKVYFPPKPFPYVTGPPTLVGTNNVHLTIDEIASESVPVPEPEPEPVSVPVPVSEPVPTASMSGAGLSFDLSEFM